MASATEMSAGPGRLSNRGWPERSAPPSFDALPCPAAVRTPGALPGVHGRRKDCLVRTPEAEPRQ